MRKRTLYVSEILQRSKMNHSPVCLKLVKNNHTIWFDTLEKAIEVLQYGEYWNKQVKYWHVTKAVEYIIFVAI